MNMNIAAPKYTFLQLAQAILEAECRPLTASEIWQIAKEKQFDLLVKSKGRTPERTLSALIYVNMRDKGDDSPFYKADFGPTRFFLRKAEKNKTANQASPIINVQTKYKESDLYPFVDYYAYNHLRAFLLSINHQKSKKNKFGEWLHPDLVGCSFEFKDWDNEVLEISLRTGNKPVILYSFELKKELNENNLREAYFQAVSNSSWANEGYIAAAEIFEDEDFFRELKRLSMLFGIGVIKIDTSEPDNTEIIFPAKRKENVDWETMNKLSTLNSDFNNFLKAVINSIKIVEIESHKFNIPLERELIIKNFKDKSNT